MGRSVPYRHRRGPGHPPDRARGTQRARRGRTGAGTGWLTSWLRADAAARRAADEILDTEDGLTEPRLARDLAAALPDSALLWAASSLPIRDLDHHMTPRDGVRVLASRGASGIDGTTSAAIGAALAHQAAGGGPAVALLGDLAFLHDAPGLIVGPGEPARPVPDRGQQRRRRHLLPAGAGRVPGPFERVFGTPHGADLGQLAAAARLPYTRLERVGDLPAALAGSGLRVVEARTDREVGAALRGRLQQAASAAAAAAASAAPEVTRPAR